MSSMGEELALRHKVLVVVVNTARAYHDVVLRFRVRYIADAEVGTAIETEGAF